MARFLTREEMLDPGFEPENGALRWLVRSGVPTLQQYSARDAAWLDIPQVTEAEEDERLQRRSSR